MAGQFFQRLRAYYLDVAAVLRGEAKVASVFPTRRTLECPANVYRSVADQTLFTFQESM